MSSLVGDVMTRNVVSVPEHAQYREIVLVMRGRSFGACPVLDPDDAVIGVVSEDDLLVKEANPGKAAAGLPARRISRTPSTAGRSPSACLMGSGRWTA